MGIGYNPSIVTRGLIFYLDAKNTKSYPGSGTAYTDIASGLVSSASSVAYSAGALTFNGVDSYITWASSSLFDTQTPSVEVWTKTNATTQNGFFFEKGAVNTQYSLFQEGANLTWRHNAGGLTSLTVPAANWINTSNWAHIVGTRDGGSRSIYVNGALANSGGTSGTLNTNQGVQQVGMYVGGGYPFSGQIAIVKVYNVALTQAEVQQNFNALRGRFGV